MRTIKSIIFLTFVALFFQKGFLFPVPDKVVDPYAGLDFYSSLVMGGGSGSSSNQPLEVKINVTQSEKLLKIFSQKS